MIITDRSRPEPIFVAALIGADRILRAGVVVNYTPDRAVRYDLEGKALESLSGAYYSGDAQLLLNGRPVAAGMLTPHVVLDK